MPQWMDGKLVASEVYDRLGRLRLKRPPKLVVFLVGDDPASQTYVGSKTRKCAELGFAGETRAFPASVDRATFATAVAAANADPSVDGILIQLPLPRHLDKDELMTLVSPEKDADGLHPQNLGNLLLGLPAPVSCTPAGVIFLLEHYRVPLEGKRAVVVGRSDIVGKPMAQLLLRRNATVTVCHSRTRDLGDELRRADVAVIAIGKPKFFSGADFRSDATVVDVGIHRVDGKIVGDVDTANFSAHSGFVTPVPGGVGPLTIAMLMKNVAEASARRQGAPFKF